MRNTYSVKRRIDVLHCRLYVLLISFLMSDSGAVVTPNRQNLMVDLSQAVVFVREIYEAVDPHVATTVFEALARFERNGNASFVIKV